MLYSIDSGKDINHIPHKKEFEIWCSRLSKHQLKTIRAKLQGMISGDEIHTAGWMPGSNWNGTPWQPIYEKACEKDFNAAARCFGLFVWEAFLQHHETWSFGRYELNGEEIGSITYFRVDPKS